MNELVSIIISTKDSEKTVENCLKSIKNQTYPHIELIVVDNHSRDSTREIAKRYADKLLTHGPERSAQRNFGAKKSSGKFLAFIDADMLLGKTVVEECVRKINHDPSLSALVIPEISMGKGFWAACRALEKKCYLGDEKIEGARFIDKKTFNDIGGFSDFVSGEDWDFTLRVRAKGYKIGRIETVVYHDEGELKLIDDLKKKYYYATKSLPYVKRHIKGPRDVALFIFRPAFFRNWRLLVQDPLHAVGLFVMKFLEFGVGPLGIFAARLQVKKR